MLKKRINKGTALYRSKGLVGLYAYVEPWVKRFFKGEADADGRSLIRYLGMKLTRMAEEAKVGREGK